LSHFLLDALAESVGEVVNSSNEIWLLHRLKEALVEIMFLEMKRPMTATFECVEVFRRRQQSINSSVAQPELFAAFSDDKNCALPLIKHTRRTRMQVIREHVHSQRPAFFRELGAL
jgi:hypothetical protein